MALTRLATFCALAAAGAFIAGCGSSDDRTSLVSASKCLVRTEGATVDFGTPLHEVMSGGALRVVFPTNEVQLGFGNDVEEAREIGDEVRAGMSGTIAAGDSPPDELVSVSRNVLLAWKESPSEQERAAVANCLE